MRFRRQLDADGVAGADVAVGEDDGHYSGFANELAVLVAVEGGSHETRMDAIQLGTGVSESGYFDNGGGAQVEAAAGREREQVDPAGGDVFAHLTG
jgi:hypothetical protein